MTRSNSLADMEPLLYDVVLRKGFLATRLLLVGECLFLDLSGVAPPLLLVSKHMLIEEEELIELNKTTSIAV